MTGDTETALLIAIEGLRSDVREDLRDIKTELQGYMTTHGAEHKAANDERMDAHDRFDAFIRNAELATARRDGALGVVRFTFELFARHSAAIVKLVLAVAGAALVVGGNVHIAIS